MLCTSFISSLEILFKYRYLCYTSNGELSTVIPRWRNNAVFTPKIANEQTHLLAEALLTLENTEEALRFLEDVLSVQELASVSQRMAVAVMLQNKVTYQDIVQNTGASTATISRVNRSLQYGAEGYHLVLSRLSPSTQQIQDEE